MARPARTTVVRMERSLEAAVANAHMDIPVIPAHMQNLVRTEQMDMCAKTVDMHVEPSLSATAHAYVRLAMVVIVARLTWTSASM